MQGFKHCFEYLYGGVQYMKFCNHDMFVGCLNERHFITLTGDF